MSTLAERDPLLAAYQLCREVPEGDVLVDYFSRIQIEGSPGPHPYTPEGFVGVVAGIKVGGLEGVNFSARLLVQEIDPEVVVWSVSQQAYWHLNRTPASWTWEADDPATVGTWVAGKHTLEGKLLTHGMRDQYRDVAWRHTIVPHLPTPLKGRDLLDPKLHLYHVFTRDIGWNMVNKRKGSHQMALNAHFPARSGWEDREPHSSLPLN